MSNYGLLPQGFVAKDLQKILTEMIDLCGEYYGQDFDSTSMNPLIKLLEVNARGNERTWAEVANYFDSTQLWFTSGKFLRDLGALFGKEIKESEKSIGTITFTKTITKDVLLPSGLVIDNNSDTFLKEYTILDEKILPSVITVRRGSTGGGTDALNSFNGFTNLFNIQGVEWISDNYDGSSPYTSGVDYISYTPGDDEIDWSPGGSEPSANAIYYVKVTGYKAYITMEAKNPGSAYNVIANELYNLQTTIKGIGSATNEESIQNGRDDESELEFKTRIAEAGFLLDNDRQMEGFLQQLFRIRSAKVNTQAAGGHFRSLVNIDDPSAMIPIYNEAVDETERRKGTGVSSVAIIRMVRGSVGNDDQFPVPYYQSGDEKGVWQIYWVSANRDGSSPYTSGVDYETYQDYDNHITWIPAGSPPSADEQFFVMLVRAVEIAETIPIEVIGDLILDDGYDLNTVSDDLSDVLSSLINSNGINDELYFSDIAKAILDTDGVSFLTNLRLRAKLRIWKGSAGGVDQLPIRGQGFADNVSDIVFVNDDKDGGGTSYSHGPDYLWNQTNKTIRSLDWSPGGSEPSTDYPYWIYLDFKGDIIVGDDMIVDFEGVEFQLLTS